MKEKIMSIFPPLHLKGFLQWLDNVPNIHYMPI